MEEENCKNCNQIISGNYCSNCGQKKYSRIDKKYILDQLQYTILHTDKGLLYSIKSIIKNPGKTAREFIEGKRKNQYNPILLVSVLCGISVFLSLTVGEQNIVSDFYSDVNLNPTVAEDIITFTYNYMSVIMLFLIPFFAFFSKLSFRKWGHNYYEHVVMNSYILSLYLLLEIIIIFPITYIARNSLDLYYQIFGFAILIIPIMLIWFFKGFYAQKTLKSIIGRVFVTVSLTIVGFVIFMVILSLVFGIYFAINPEAAEYFVPQ